MKSKTGRLSMQVTWVEHAEVEEKPVHQIFSDYVCNGMAFGAQRWLTVLQRQCERVASLMARNISDLGGSLFIYFPSFLLFLLFEFTLTTSFSQQMHQESNHVIII